MSTQFLIRIDEPLKHKVSLLAKSEGKTASQLVRELLETYVHEHDAESYVSDLWQRISNKLHKKGKKLADIKRVIRTVRKAK